MQEKSPTYYPNPGVAVSPQGPYPNQGYQGNVAVCPPGPGPNPGYQGNVAVCPPGPSGNIGFIGDGGDVSPPFNPEFIGKEVLEMPPTAPPMETTIQRPLAAVNLGTLSDGDIREACLEYASQNCCYGKKFIRETIFSEVTDTPVYHYMLESYGEKRQTVDKVESYRGQYVDGPENGPPPRPWDIVVNIASMFQDAQARVEIPHTAYVKECYRCVGNCRIRCDSCYGRGGSSCISCNSTGRRDNGQCFSCSGTGRSVCFTCDGTGQVECGVCDGRGKLKHFKQLVITWKNHIDNFVTATYTLPKPLILAATGRQILNEQNLRVLPVTHSDSMLINESSKSLVARHQTSFPQEFIRMQRHSLRIVPLTKVKFSWKSKTGDFYIFGFDKKAYFEDYPQKCCCCTCC